MNEIVVDTTPFQYLHQLRQLHLLQLLFTRTIAPEAVAVELDAGRARHANLPDLRHLDWIEVRVPRSLEAVRTGLGRGERGVLALALEVPGALAALDDGQARREARRLGLALTGTLGILVRAKQAGLVESVAPLLQRLEALRFRFDDAMRRHVLEIASELEPDA